MDGILALGDGGGDAAVEVGAIVAFQTVTWILTARFEGGEQATREGNGFEEGTSAR